MKKVSQDYYKKLFPELEKIYNDSKKMYKLWNKSVNSYTVVDNIEDKIKQYWGKGYIFM